MFIHIIFAEISIMNIAIRSTTQQQQELKKKGFPEKIALQWLNEDDSMRGITADALFDLTFNDNDIASNDLINDLPVFVNGVNCVCKDIDRPNYIRLNAWNGFINRGTTELACNNAEFKKKAEDILNTLEWQYAWVADDYGFIAARIIAMIINEAYYALDEEVSTKEQIDIAMKLGTNYPYGPFEWSEKIGLKNVVQLLQNLATQDERYVISALLLSESQQF